MKRLARCCAVFAIAVVALGAAVRFSMQAAEPQSGTKDILEKITLTAEKEKASGLEATCGNLALPIGGHRAIELASHEIEAEAVEKKDASGKVFASGLQFTCDPRFINCLTVNGSPLKAKKFSYTVDPISWQAGDGWPVYTTYCPNPGYSTSMNYPAAKIHQIVPSIAGQNYFVGCSPSATCESNASGQICFAVNDNNYGDNRGYFVVTIYGIVP